MPSIRPAVTGLCTALMLALAACGAPPERTCPAPIGRIVIEDCDVYQRRFEALRVDVDLLLGSAAARVNVARRSLRTRAKPAEALDVLSHQLHAMCRDHNNCRLHDQAGRDRRAELDATVTAITILRDRIRGEADPAARDALVEELGRVLLRAAGSAPEARRGDYRSWLPWFGAALLPPMPDPPVGAPVLAGVDFDTQARFADGQGIVGYGPRARVDLWWPKGTYAIDDALVMDWGNGHTTDCPLHGSGNGADHRSIGCHAPEEMVSNAPIIEVAVRYRTGIDGIEHPIGTARAPIVSHVVDDDGRAPSVDVDHDPIARVAKLVWRPHDGALPSQVDQPSLWVVLKLRKYERPTARCRIGGEDAFGVLEPSRSSGQEGTHQDRPRYRRTGPGSSVSVSDPFVEWWRYDFPLPLGVPRGEDADPDDLPDGIKPWPRVGRWQCTVTLDGEPVRRIEFNVKKDGRLDPHPEQTRAARAEWLLDTEVVPSSVEEPL